MCIAVMGSGGVGGCFGGLPAKAGRDVTFIARGEHLGALRASRLRVESVRGDYNVAPAPAFRFFYAALIPQERRARA